MDSRQGVPVYSNKRIVKNTIITNIQMLVSMLVSFISARLVLQALGASDFGLYGVVGGVVAMFAFISSSMLDTTTRFLNYEIGKVGGDLNRVFNVSIAIHLVASVILFFLFETIGLIYIKYYLNVDVGKEADAMFVFQITSMVACIGIINIPYKALFFSHEKFSTIAIIEIVNSLFKLFLIVCLLYYKGNSLRFYAICMSASAIFSFIAYWALFKKLWPFLSIKRRKMHLKEYKEQISYNGWSLLSTFFQVVKTQGGNILINLFFSTVANAAYVISLTVQASVDALSSNFSRAATPQITRSIAEGNDNKALSLIYSITRIHLLVMLLSFFTLYIDLDLVLSLWLGSNIPPSTLIFCKYTIVLGLIETTRCGIIQYVRAIGKVKIYYILMSVCFFIGLPISYYLFSKGYPPYSIIIVYILIDIVNRIFDLLLLHKLFHFNVKSFLKKSWLRPLLVFLLLLFISTFYHQIEISNLYLRICGVICMFMISLSLCFCIGIMPKEKERVLSFVRNKL